MFIMITIITDVITVTLIKIDTEYKTDFTETRLSQSSECLKYHLGLLIKVQYKDGPIKLKNLNLRR